MDTATTLSLLGLELPGPAYLFGVIVFCLVGFAAWRHARRTQRKRSQWIAMALMLYPYAVASTWLLYVIGALLCTALWWDARLS
jgi:hypothetical protein